jgi:hypothetical protein
VYKSKVALVAVAVILPFLCVSSLFAQSPAATHNVVLIVADGLRWQEVFTGADPTLMDVEHGGLWVKPDALKHDFWRDDVNERRTVLLPFIWSMVAKQGQIFGNQTKGSVARVTNSMHFSYPGYNEMLTGAPDSRIDTNDFGPNPNVTVFEWLNRKPEFQGQVAAFATWVRFKDIFNIERSKLAVQAGWDLPYHGMLTERQRTVNEFYATTAKFWDENAPNNFLQGPLLDFVHAKEPRLLFVAYGETDIWAHAGRYDLVLQSAQQFDGFVKDLWDTMQAMPGYRGRTTFIVTADHGRGSGLTAWKEHGAAPELRGSENIWIAVIGPDTPPLGERSDVGEVTQSQIAATVACFLSRDYRHEVPAAASAIVEVLPKSAPCRSGGPSRE